MQTMKHNGIDWTRYAWITGSVLVHLTISIRRAPQCLVRIEGGS